MRGTISRGRPLGDVAVKVVVTGGTGFVGQLLVARLLERGDQVVVLSRRPQDAPSPGLEVAAWNPSEAGPWQRVVDGADAVVHLAGAPVAQRWTKASKAAIYRSRVDSARLLARAIAEAKAPPTRFVSASAAGYYGADRPGEALDEGSAPGGDFLAEVCIAWEAAVREAEGEAVRTAQLRFGVVLDADGGALDKMLLPLRVGVARVGKGTNHLPWIHRADVVGLLLAALDDERFSGPINTAAPEAATAGEVARAIADAIRRPVIPSPEAAVRLALGEAAVILTGSLHLVPARADALGYAWQHPTLQGAMQAIFG